MIYNKTIMVIFWGLFAAASVEFASEKPKAAAPPDQERIVRITVQTVQTDVLVTDRQGRLVPDLGIADFEVFEDGHARTITHCLFIPPTPEKVAPAPGGTAGKPPAMPRELREDQVRRVVALVVDDFSLSPESTYRLRDVLNKFIDEQMQAGDLAAVILTSRGGSVLQQFTSDRNLLHAAVADLRFSNYGSHFSPSDRALFDPSYIQALEKMVELEHEILGLGMFGAVNLTIQRLRQLPGRKSIVLFYDEFSLPVERSDALRLLVDQANRAGVSIYPVEAAGLRTLMPGESIPGRYRVGREDPSPAARFARLNTGTFIGSLDTVAKETGGILIRNTNDLSLGLSLALNDQSAYYLIGFTPGADTFRTAGKTRKFHKFTVRIRREGMVVRTRGGFFGVPDAAIREAGPDPGTEIWAAMVSPFRREELRLGLNAGYDYQPAHGAYIHLTAHLDPAGLTFTADPDGWQRAEVRFATLLFDNDGAVSGQKSMTYTVRTRDDLFQQLLNNGLVLTQDIPVARPGHYQLLAVAGDTASGKLGTAGWYIPVPETRKGRLAVSGLTLKRSGQPARMTGRSGSPSEFQGQAAGEAAGDVFVGGDPDLDSTGWRFPAGTTLEFQFRVYNARVDSASGRPRIEFLTILLCNGQPVEGVPPAEVRAVPGPADNELQGSGRLLLPASLGANRYELRLIALDRLTGKKQGAAMQRLEFVVP